MPQTDIPVLSVSEISLSLKACIEQVFACVRVRGEVSGVKKAPSGHIYFSLKDSDAVLSAVAWRGRSAQTAAAITEGLEIICSGKLSTYPGRSNYQMIVETAEPAGIGALLKLLNERKEKLTKEGLFDPARKKNLPYLPDVIGVITSPTGAVIRDIMHRLKDRFGRHVLLWPVLVQGEEAPAQITAAIQGFNKIPSDGLHTPDGIIPRPDVLIVARGGGSLEDLWGFNEECVVRAAAESQIPLISAVGHETDTTLIDYAADRRAPTPTAAAEMAVPVQYELISRLNNLKHRQDEAVLKYISDKQKQIALLARSVPNLSEAVNGYIQKLDDRCIRLKMAVSHYLNTAENKFNTLKSLLKSYSYTCVLERGFALVTDAKGKVVSSAAVCITQPTLTIAFQDGAVQTTPIPSHNTLKKNKKSDELSPHQGDLFHDK